MNQEQIKAMADLGFAWLLFNWVFITGSIVVVCSRAK